MFRLDFETTIRILTWANEKKKKKCEIKKVHHKSYCCCGHLTATGKLFCNRTCQRKSTTGLHLMNTCL